MKGGLASNSTNIAEILFLYATHVLLPAILVLVTGKRSALRYISIPISVYILYRAINVASLLGPGFLWCELARLFLTVTCQSLNLLLINPKDSSDMPHIFAGSTSLLRRIYFSAQLFTHPRGINTPWQINNVPAQPSYYQQKAMPVPTRGVFLIRQVAIASWQYLTLDIFSTLALQQALEQEKLGALPNTVQWNLSIEQCIERILSNLMAGFVVSRILIDFHHRAFSIIAVGTGLDSTTNWPPLFGKATDACSLRGFWSRFWHQLLRQPLTSISRFITRDVLGLASNSILQRYMNICIVFFLSGGLHVVLDIVQGIPPQESGALLFFALAPAGLMVEDSIQALWRYLSNSRKTRKIGHREFPSWWQRLLGLIWTMAWLGTTSTWYFYPQMLRPQNQNLVPFSFVDRAGLSAILAAVVFGGAALVLNYQVEV